MVSRVQRLAGLIRRINEARARNNNRDADEHLQDALKILAQDYFRVSKGEKVRRFNITEYNKDDT